MNTIRSIAAGNSHRLPARLKLISTRLGSLILLFQRMPVVQFLFPEANVIGGAAMANTVSLAVTTLIGLGAFDSVAGVSPPTITQNLPLANSTTVPAAVGSALNFKVTCAADSYPKSWKTIPDLPLKPTTATSGALTGLCLTYTLNPPSNNWVNYITGTPTVAGTSTVTIYGNRYTNNSGTGDNVVSQDFTVYILGFSTQPLASQTINSGAPPVTLTCAATGRRPGDTLKYEWFRGESGTETTPVGTNSASFTTPSLASSTSYWVKITSTLSGYAVSAKSQTAVITVNPALTPFETWASGLPEGQRGANQTPMGDGVTNLEKFAFNLNPLAPDVRHLTVGADNPAGLPGGAYTGGVLRIEFLRRKATTNPGITYTAQFGSDLGGWTDIPVGTPAGTSIDSTWERVTVNDPTGGPKRFGRVKVIQTP